MSEWIRGACPSCDHPDAFARHRGGYALCHRCGYTERGDAPWDDAQAQQHRARQSLEAARLVALSSPLEPGDPVWRYLERRGLPTPGGEHDPVHTDIRYLDACWHPKERDMIPALIAVVRDAASRIVAASRLWLDEDGTKAKVKPSRMFVGPTKGAAFRTSGAKIRGRTVVLCEGIEDALAASRHHGLWAWAALSAGALRTVELPAGIGVVLIPDRDPVGLRHANRAAADLRRRGHAVEVRYPTLGDEAAVATVRSYFGL